jgi:hypothetical protein
MDANIYPWNKHKTNTLLTKDEVGKSKPSTYNLPGGTFAYGKPLDRDIEGAKEGKQSLLIPSFHDLELPFLNTRPPPRPRFQKTQQDVRQK